MHTYIAYPRFLQLLCEIVANLNGICDAHAYLGLKTSRQFPEVSRKVSGNLEKFPQRSFLKNLEIQKGRN